MKAKATGRSVAFRPATDRRSPPDHRPAPSAHHQLRQLTYTDQVATPTTSPSPGAAGDPNAGTLQTLSTTLTLTRFGVPAAVTAPPVSSPAP